MIKVTNLIVTSLVVSLFSFCLMTCDLGGDVDFTQELMLQGEPWIGITEMNEAAELLGAIDSDDWCYSNNIPSAKTAKKGVVPAGFYISAAYPNPTNGVTNISYGLPQESYVTVKIYKSNMGSISSIRTLLTDGYSHAGYHSLSWDCRDDNGHKVMPGIYRCFITVSSNEYSYYDCHGDIQVID